MLIELFGLADSYSQAAEMAMAAMKSGEPLRTIERAAAISIEEA